MRAIVAILIFMMASCDQPVSQEQREAMQEEQKLRVPVKISEEEILSKAFEEARADFKDTVVAQYQWKSYFVKPADSLLAEIWLAYEYAASNNIKASDNVQMQDDMVIYSEPVIENDSLKRMHVAYLPKKSIVLKLADQ